MQVINNVTFFGSSTVKKGDATYEDAFAVAKLVAQSGRRVVNGGGPGVMLAATSGAKECGGKTTVVYYRPELATTFEGKSSFNYADKQYEEVNYIMRTKKLLELGDIYITFNGGTGTISEFAMAWGLARLYFGHHKPLILFGNFWHKLMGEFKKHMIIRPEEFEVFTIVESPDDILKAIDKYEEILSKNRHKHLEGHPKERFLML